MTKIKTSMPQSLEELIETMKRAQEEGADVKFVNAETGEEGVPPEIASLLGDKMGLNIGQKLTGDKLVQALLNVLAKHQTKPKFIPGQFVRYMDEVRYVKDPRSLHMVVDTISPPMRITITDDNDGNCTTYRWYDVIVARADNHGGICRYLADSRELELYPDADKLLKTNS